MKKRIALLMIACFLFSLAAGCGQKENVPADKAEAFAEPAYDWEKGSGEKLVIWGVYPGALSAGKRNFHAAVSIPFGLSR